MHELGNPAGCWLGCALLKGLQVALHRCGAADQWASRATAAVAARIAPIAGLPGRSPQTSAPVTAAKATLAALDVEKTTEEGS